MTPEELDKIEARAAKATEGPWGVCQHMKGKKEDEGCSCGYRGGLWDATGELQICEMGTTITKGEEALSPRIPDRETTRDNARFIAAARQDVPALVAEVRRLRDAQQWQPIETAPKDGTVFLALNYDTEVFAARWSKDHKRCSYRTCQQSFPESHTKTKLANGDFGWVRNEEFAKENRSFQKEWCLWQAMYDFAPTHWMPLPNPPVQS